MAGALAAAVAAAGGVFPLTWQFLPLIQRAHQIKPL